MSRRRVLPRRSASRWGVRGMLAAAALVGGYFGVTRSLAYPLREASPRQAQALSPGDGRITALVAQQYAGAGASPADRARADQLARTALRQDPTALSAAATLGFDAQLRGDTPRARRLFAYAEKLSRRDVQTQLWAIEDAVGRGDVPGALRHYDLALRTSRTAPDLLFPVLASAISDPAVRTALVRTLAARPGWGDAFLAHVTVRGPDPRATARLLVGVRRAGIAIPQGASAEIVNLLIFRDHLGDAWNYYASVRPGADRRRSRDATFDAALASPSPFDWTALNDGAISTSIQRGERGGLFAFAAPASVGGALLRQVQMLPPGSYRLDGRSRELDQPQGASPYWVLSCRDGRELGRVDVSNSDRNQGAFAGRFDVPAGCPLQTLALVARPSDMVGGLGGQIERARLVPMR